MDGQNVFFSVSLKSPDFFDVIVETLNAKIAIYSANDAEGRWLYQQLNANTVNRLRGTLKIDTPSRIEMHFKSNPSTMLD